MDRALPPGLAIPDQALARVGAIAAGNGEFKTRCAGRDPQALESGRRVRLQPVSAVDLDQMAVVATGQLGNTQHGGDPGGSSENGSGRASASPRGDTSACQANTSTPAATASRSASR